MVMEAGFKQRTPGTRARLRDRQVTTRDAILGLPQSRFSSENVPFLLWPDLLNEFGTEYEYHTAEGDVVTGLTGILIEGVEDEFRSPGRYARFWVDMRDLPREPRSADWILLGDRNYDVESVDATLYNISRLVIKLPGQCWNE